MKKPAVIIPLLFTCLLLPFTVTASAATCDHVGVKTGEVFEYTLVYSSGVANLSGAASITIDNVSTGIPCMVGYTMTVSGQPIPHFTGQQGSFEVLNVTSPNLIISKNIVNKTYTGTGGSLTQRFTWDSNGVLEKLVTTDSYEGYETTMTRKQSPGTIDGASAFLVAGFVALAVMILIIKQRRCTRA